MARIYLGGAGGAPTNNVIRSLRESTRRDYLIGASSVAPDLLLASVDERHVVPEAGDPEYTGRLLTVLQSTRPDLIHVQNDAEVLAVSRLRAEIELTGARTFLPSREAIETFVDKYLSFVRWRQAGLPVPDSVLLQHEGDLREAFQRFRGSVWLRATQGGGGRGALPTNDVELAIRWVDRFDGWGSFTAAENLTSSSVTWQSLWYQGRLVAAQTRRRLSWAFGDRTVSGVTGVTAVAETWSSQEITTLGQRAIHAVEAVPHGIYGVDMTYDANGGLRLTEVNVGRFFTTIYFFTRAGFNFPAWFADLALGDRLPPDNPILDPLPDGLLWVRGMDIEPVLSNRAELAALAGDPW